MISMFNGIGVSCLSVTLLIIMLLLPGLGIVLEGFQSFYFALLFLLFFNIYIHNFCNYDSEVKGEKYLK